MLCASMKSSPRKPGGGLACLVEPRRARVPGDEIKPLIEGLSAGIASDPMV